MASCACTHIYHLVFRITHCSIQTWDTCIYTSILIIHTHVISLVCSYCCTLIVSAIITNYICEPVATTLVTRMATTAPQLEPFNSRKDDWNSWSRRFKQWLTLSSYSTSEGSEVKQQAAFCTYIDSSTFKLLCSLCAPNKPEELSLEQLLTKLDAQFGTKKLVLAERYRFYSYKQQEGQSLSEYIAKLRHLAASCDWSAEQLEDSHSQ